MYEIATLRRSSMFVANPKDDPGNPKAKGTKDEKSMNSTTVIMEVLVLLHLIRSTYLYLKIRKMIKRIKRRKGD